MYNFLSKKISVILTISFAILITNPIFSQDSTKKIYIGNFKSLSPNLPGDISSKISDKLSGEFNSGSYSTYKVDSISLNNIKSSLPEDAFLYVTGYYKKEPNKNLSIYVQIYDPATGNLIDAMNIEDEWDKEGFEDIKLPENEIKEDNDERISKISRKVSARIKINPNKKENRDNINRYLVNSPVGKEENFPIKKVEEEKQSQDVFKFLADMEVVTATRSKTKIKDAPAAVYVITHQQIKERGYRVLTDALADVPGFDFQHTYGIYPHLIHQRGLVGENNRTLVYIDGIPDNNINEFAVLAGTNQFPLFNVDRIEIVSGPASSLYGANAFNGIINIITKDGKGHAGHEVGATYGGWESDFRNPGYSLQLSSRGSVGEKENATMYSVGGFFYKTDGPNFGGIGDLKTKSFNSNSVTDYLENKSCGGPCVASESDKGYYWTPGYKNSRMENYNVTAKVTKGGFRFQTVNWHFNQGEGTFANGTNQIDIKERGFETNNLDTRNLARGLGALYGVTYLQGFRGSQWDFQNNSVSGGYTYNFNDKLSLDTELLMRSTQVAGSSREEYPNVTDRYTYYRPGDVTESPHYSRLDRNYGAETKLQYDPNEMFSTIVGVSAHHFIATKDYGSSENYTYNNFSSYLQQVIRPNKKLAFTLGYRYDEFTTFGNASSPRISAIFNPTNKLTLKLLAGTGFRAPTVKELFAETKQRKNNPGLQPERLRSFEFGIGYRILKNLYTTAHFYQNKVTNLILEVTTTDDSPRNGAAPSGGTWQQNQNLGEAHIRGAEIDNSFILNEKWKFNLSYTYNYGYFDKLPSSLPSSPSTAGRSGDNYLDDIRGAIYKTYTGVASIPARGDIPIIAPNKVFIGATWSPISNLSIYGGMNYVDVRRTKATNPTKSVEGYKFFKLNIHWENIITQGVYINLLVNNATNQLFFDPGIRSASGSYYPTAHPLEKRNIWLSIGYKF
ncbi:MAG: TonB-dependent receptor [Leptospiraceae bacterium]|nr:TonB-dependent receptor [Leptospiraceae bacterium]